MMVTLIYRVAICLFVSLSVSLLLLNLHAKEDIRANKYILFFDQNGDEGEAFSVTANTPKKPAT